MPNTKVYEKTISGDKKLCGVCKKWMPLEDFWCEGHNRQNDGRHVRRWCCKYCSKKISNGDITKEQISKLKSEFRVMIEKETIKENSETVQKIDLINALIELSRHDIQRLKGITKKEFVSKTNASQIVSEFDFDEIKICAEQELYNLGLHRPFDIRLKEGRYLIVGDSHGKHTKTKMFKLLKNLNKNLKFKKVIHIGHILDDDNVINYFWKDFDNLIILAKTEEAKEIERGLHDGHHYDVVRKGLYLGNLYVSNQDLISDYVKFGIESVDSRIFDKSTIINTHKHELDSRCSYLTKNIYASPGCICEKHIVKTIRQIDFTSGYQVKIAYPSSFIKYRRMTQLMELWEQGVVIVDVDKDGEYTISMCRIKKVGDNYCTSYFDKIYSEDKVLEPDEKIFINSDLHVPKHSKPVLEIQNAYIKDYKPNVFINLGDILNSESLNHHKMSKNEVITSSYLEELSSLDWILNQMSSWADKKYLMLGNHERFIQDFHRKFPQLKEILFNTLINLIEDQKYSVIKFKDVLVMNDVKFIHGDMKMYGQKGGGFMSKVSNTFKPPVIVGHLHYCGVKSGCYMVGLSGQYDQEYNEVNASNWIHGFGICNQYKGVSFVSTIPIISNKIIVGNKKYLSTCKNFWDMPKTDVKIKFTREKK